MPESLETLTAEAFGHLTAQGPSSIPVRGQAIARIRYSHDGMIDLIIAHPAISQNEIAAHFGYSPSWVSQVFASDVFQARLAERRKEVIDPALIATVDERIRALTLRSMTVLMEKLDKPVVSDTVALRAFELGARAAGLGGNAPPKLEPVNLDALAERLIALNPQREKAIEGEVLSKENS